MAKRYPLYERTPKRTEVRYVLEDPLLRFWFRFVFPNESDLQRNRAGATFRDRIRPQLRSYYGLCYERLCREALPDLYRREGVTAKFDVGEYWDKRVQIDVIGLREDGWTDIGECKWGPVRSARAVAQEVRDKSAHFPNERDASLGLRAFVRRKPRVVDDSVQWHDLADVYESTPED